MERVVQVNNLRKVFQIKKKKFFKTIESKQFIAVDNVSFHINKGEIFGLLGPNGAGKTTVIKMIIGLLRPSSGNVLVNNVDTEKEHLKALKQIGSVIAGDRGIYWKLTARENLEYFANLYGYSCKNARERTNYILKRLDLIEKADIPVEKFSTGMKQKVSLGKALIPDSPVLLLDEPTLGLDPQSALNLREIIIELKNEGKTILLTTHYMEEADFLCDRIAIIDNGQIIALDTPEKLKESISDLKSIQIDLQEIDDETIKNIQKISSITSVIKDYISEENCYRINIHHNNGNDIIQSIIDILGKNSINIKNVNILIPSLEDVFIKLTGKKLRE